MCTALSLVSGSHYFGRTLDLTCGFGEAVVIAPRRFPLPLRRLPALNTHLAIIGMAAVQDGFPLYFDAANEAGLAAAGLNFPGYAHYGEAAAGRTCIASFELIPWLLGQCASVSQARARLENAVICRDAFSPALSPSPLHFMLSDAVSALVVEPVAGGLRLYDNPAGVLTNSPPFPYHLSRLRDFAALSPDPPANTFAPSLDLPPESNGTGTLGLPGDLTSPSRFVRAAYLRAHSVCPPQEEASVSQFFHLLDGVSLARGAVRVKGKDDITQYACCISTQKGVYYYTTYGNRRITAVSLSSVDADGKKLSVFPLVRDEQILFQRQPQESAPDFP